jgi:hypothetical protein
MAVIKQFLAVIAASVFISLLSISEVLAYSFTKIADSNESLFSSFGRKPAINNEGKVAFSASLKQSGSGIYTSDGSSIKTVVDTNGSFQSFADGPSMNDKGTVAIKATLDNGNIGIWTFTSDGNRTPIIENGNFTLQNPVINNQGSVVFFGNLTAGRSIYFSKEGQTSIIANTNETYSILDGYDISNDQDKVAISASLTKGGREIFTTMCGETNVIANTTSNFSFLYPPVINSTGTVAFYGILQSNQVEDIVGIYSVTNGETTSIADNTGLFRRFDNLAINDSGNVVFRGILRAGGFGIYTGTNPETDKVIATGDTLHGSTVTNIEISPQAINNARQIVFYAQLANGTTGIFRAEPPKSQNLPQMTRSKFTINTPTNCSAQ